MSPTISPTASWAYVSYSKGFKSGGINLAGIPTDAAGNPVVTTARIKPEDGTTYEVGLKTQFFDRTLTANLAVFHTTVHDYQVNVVDSGPGALRGYLSNIEKVESKGVELDAGYAPGERFTSYLSAAFTEGKYVSFVNGPCLIERIGTSTAACDLSGRPLPGLPKWALSAGAEYRQPAFGGMAFFGIDGTYRSSQYSDASDSQYMVIDAYSLINLRAGYRSENDVWEAFVWTKNVFDTEYFQYMSVQLGNSGGLFALLGDPRTYGATLRLRF